MRNSEKIKPESSRLISLVSAALILLIVSFGFGMHSGHSHNSVYDLILSLKKTLELTYRHVMNVRDEILFSDVDANEPAITTIFPDRLNAGLILLAGMDAKSRNTIRVVTRDGTLVHDWQPDWFEIWGDRGAFPDSRWIGSQPGSFVHGIEMLPSGDIVFNFEHLSTVRMDPCGEVVWKLENLGHHSVHLAEDGMLWVPAETYYEQEPTGQRNHEAPLRSWTLQKISPAGEILETLDVIDILEMNDLHGLLFLSSLENDETVVSGDTLHLNDIDIFPAALQSEIFSPGDIMFSLRNINTVIVIDAETHQVKFRATGQFLRQHDPDFAPGDRISLFDNRTMLPARGQAWTASRILELDTRSGEATVISDIDGDAAFSTAIMGTHQRLENGNILVVSAREGRILEILRDGSLAWEFQHRVDEGRNGLVTIGTLLPPEMDEAFFAGLAAACD